MRRRLALKVEGLATGPRRKPTDFLSVGHCYLVFGASFAQPVQIGCTADFVRFWPILGPKVVKIFSHNGKAVWRISSVRWDLASICIYNGQEG